MLLGGVYLGHVAWWCVSGSCCLMVLSGSCCLVILSGSYYFPYETVSDDFGHPITLYALFS